MATAAVGLSVEEYLSTSYRPDCDYVDGRLEERNLGEFDHGRLQFLIALELDKWGERQGACAAVEVRVQVRADRFRIPDACLIRREDLEQVLRKPPLLCVEVLSPGDSIARVIERLDDYLAMGVPICWVIDPIARQGLTYDGNGLHLVADGKMRLEGTSLAVALESVFARI